MGCKAAFLFVAPKANEKEHRTVIHTPELELTVVGVGNYREAVVAAKSLIAQGVEAIELCAGFGVRGIAEIKAAVAGKALVGVVRFDGHPAFGNRSGDELF